MAKTRSGKQTKIQQTNKSNAAVVCHANAKLTPAFTMSGADAKTQPSLSAILAAIENEGGEVRKLIEDTRQSITTLLDSLENSLALLKKEQSVVTEKVEGLVEAVSGHDSRLDIIEKTCKELQATNDSLRWKVGDLEGRSRRLNLKFVGIPEGAEKGRPTAFVEGLITTLFGHDAFSRPVEVDRAHRILKPRPAAGERPRTLIAKTHRYQDRELILRLSRDRKEPLFFKDPLQHNESRVFIFPDYTAEVMNQRQAFSAVIKSLREAKVKTTLRFPAKLYVEHNEQTSIFTSPVDAKKFADSLHAAFPPPS